MAWRTHNEYICDFGAPKHGTTTLTHTNSNPNAFNWPREREKTELPKTNGCLLTCCFVWR